MISINSTVYIQGIQHRDQLSSFDKCTHCNKKLQHTSTLIKSFQFPYSTGILQVSINCTHKLDNIK